MRLPAAFIIIVLSTVQASSLVRRRRQGEWLSLYIKGASLDYPLPSLVTDSNMYEN